jgi:hypothetical protein
MDRTIRLPNDQRARRRRGTLGAIRLVRLLAAIFLHLRELVVRFSNSSGKRRGWQCSTFEVPLSRESDDRLEAKIDRLLSEQRIDPAQLDYREEEGVQG